MKNAQTSIFEFCIIFLRKDQVGNHLLQIDCASNVTKLWENSQSNDHMAKITRSLPYGHHTLRAAITKSGGNKALLGRTDLEMEISNQCGRLLAGAIIFYNMCIHSELLSRGLDKKQLKLLKKSSPVAWEHIHFTGHFTFYDNKIKIDIGKIIQNIEL